MEPIKPTPTLTSKICIQHEPADGGDAASGTIGGLPFHLTEEILRCVSPLDSVRLATVCRSWAATISERLATPTPHLFALEVLHEHPRGAIFSVPADDNEEDSQEHLGHLLNGGAEGAVSAPRRWFAGNVQSCPVVLPWFCDATCVTMYKLGTKEKNQWPLGIIWFIIL